MFNPCSCGFDLTSGSDGVPYSVAWHAEHKTFHIAAQPDVDAQTRLVLDECVSMAMKYRDLSSSNSQWKTAKSERTQKLILDRNSDPESPMYEIRQERVTEVA